MAMEKRGDDSRQAAVVDEIDLSLEAVVIPVSDVDRAKTFYTALGWRLDADVSGEGDFRVVQVTPPGSQCSVIFGSEITNATPGSAQGLHLIVSDIEIVHTELIARGAAMSRVFHDAGGVFHHKGNEGRLPGPHPNRNSYSSFASLSDLDGNGWVLQEVTTRLPGRISGAIFASASDLASALQRAASAHGKHEQRTGGKHDDSWPAWYAEYVVAEQAGTPLPT